VVAGWSLIARASISMIDDLLDAYWVADLDDDDMPAAVYPTPEAALRAWTFSERVAEERRQRREEPLRRLGKTF